MGTPNAPRPSLRPWRGVGARRAMYSHLRLCRVDDRLGTYLRTRLIYASPRLGKVPLLPRSARLPRSGGLAACFGGCGRPGQVTLSATLSGQTRRTRRSALNCHPGPRQREPNLIVRRGITTGGQVAPVTLGYSENGHHDREVAVPAYQCGSAGPVEASAKPAEPITPRHGLLA